MIAKRTIEKWRAEALRAYHASADENDYTSAKRILALTQDLLDKELLKKGGEKYQYIKKIETMNSGGGFLVTYVTLESGAVLLINDSALALYESQKQIDEGTHPEKVIIYYFKEKNK